MVKFVSVSLVALLITLGPGTAPAARHPSDSLRVKAAGGGKLFLAGNLIDGPWTLSYETGRFTVNGYGIAPPKHAPPPKLSPAEIEEHAFLRRIDAAAKSMVRLPPATAVERFVAFCDSNSQWVKIERTNPTSVMVRLWDGTPVDFSFQPINAYEAKAPRTGPQQPQTPREDSRLVHMRLIARHLGEGGVVFVDGGVEIFTRDPACVLSAISKVKSGAPLDSVELHCLPRSAQHQVENPKTLARYIDY